MRVINTKRWYLYLACATFIAMMNKLVMLKGLPGSGKTTIAKKLVNYDGYIRVNKDDLRGMLHNGKHTKANEGQVIAIRNTIISDALKRGRDVVVDDTNFNPIHEQSLQVLAKEHSAAFEVQFIDTPIEICIKRDLERFNSVGEAVIRQMYTQYIQPILYADEQWSPTEGLPECVMVDIDGTLAHMTKEGRLRFGRQAPYSWKYVGEDIVDEKLRTLLNLINNKYNIILLSGRDSSCRSETEAWLRDNNIHYDELFMRSENDNRKDYLIKLELFNKHIRGQYNVAWVFDDRLQVVNVWRAVGLTCYQVAEGNF